MVHNLVYNLCESLVENIDGVAGIGKNTPPTPITYLTQWKIVGNSEVHTLPYPDGVVLPNGYKRCEYLQSDGVAYIEVPFGFDKTDEVYVKVAMLDITHMDKYFVSPKVWNNANNRFAMGTHERENNNCWCCGYGNIGTSSSYLRPFTASDTNEHIWQYKNYKFTLDDGSIAKKVNDHLFDSETTNLRLFYGYNTPTKCKICEYRHKKANAEYRLIPCIDSNNTPCMYDVINNQAYYNSASSGSFTYELYPQPTEIWSCGEYNPIDGKYHILVQPLGGSIADIALDEPLRKVNDVADTIEFPSGTEGKALVTRNFSKVDLGSFRWLVRSTKENSVKRFSTTAKMEVLPNCIGSEKSSSTAAAALCSKYNIVSPLSTYNKVEGIGIFDSSIVTDGQVVIYDSNADTLSASDFRNYIQGIELIYQIIPTTELVDAPQIEEAESYTCEISQGGKAVEWTEFVANPT